MRAVESLALLLFTQQRDGFLVDIDGADTLYLTTRGYFFEVVMPFWLIFKGFEPEVYR